MQDERVGIVLIVDDEAPIAEILAVIVEELGYTAVIAGNGVQALQHFQQPYPRVLITDMMMPLMGGAELIRQVRLLEPPLPTIIVMSAAGKRHLAMVEADMTLQKPFEIAEVEAILLHVLEGDEKLLE